MSLSDTPPDAPPPADAGQLDDARLREVLPRLRRFARSLQPDRAAADDLVQATLERALTHGHTRRQGEALQPWLFSVLYRRFIDDTRRTRRWRRLATLFTGETPEVSPSAETVTEGRAALAAFDTLPADQRALLVMVSVDGFSYREVAQALGVPIGTVMSRLSRARAALRQQVDAPPPRPALRILR
ncbi:MAG: sigma-70 family RNA polymerase sigma factor [Pseudoxanthomonas sp.]